MLSQQSAVRAAGSTGDMATAFAAGCGELSSVGGSEPALKREALCLVRTKVPDSETQSVLVACSVMPWRGPPNWWSGLREVSTGEGLAPQFSVVLQHCHHVRRIEVEHRGKEPIVWGGDFNQELGGPITAGSIEGRVEFWEAFKRLDLESLTMSRGI
jgi:hypothetical protein